MNREIERKFLINSPECLPKDCKSITIVQGYIGLPTKGETRITVRGEDAYIDFKNTTKGDRFEYHIPISVVEALYLQDKLCDAFVYKTRLLIPYNELTIEVDIFSEKNQGLIIAEIELPEPNYNFVIPDWFGEEVTDNPQYYNSALARTPYIKHS